MAETDANHGPWCHRDDVNKRTTRRCGPQAERLSEPARCCERADRTSGRRHGCKGTFLRSAKVDVGATCHNPVKRAEATVLWHTVAFPGLLLYYPEADAMLDIRNAIHMREEVHRVRRQWAGGPGQQTGGSGLLVKVMEAQKKLNVVRIYYAVLRPY